MRNVREGNPEPSSWVASSFYLGQYARSARNGQSSSVCAHALLSGLAVGRIILPPINMLMGERAAVFVYVALAVALQCIAWLVPSFASSAVCTALIGLAISTFYAAAITLGGRLMPRSIHADAFSTMSAVGQSGSAFWPLIVGVIGTKHGIWVVEPTVLALLVAQGIVWWLVPNPRPSVSGVGEGHTL